MVKYHIRLNRFKNKYNNKNLLASLAHSHGAEHSDVNCLVLAEQYQNFYF